MFRIIKRTGKFNTEGCLYILQLSRNDDWLWEFRGNSMYQWEDIRSFKNLEDAKAYRDRIVNGLRDNEELVND